MPASLLELKKKIASVKQTGKITEAMRMVSAAKLAQTEKLDKRFAVYNDQIQQTVSRLVSSAVTDLVDDNGDSLAEVDLRAVFGSGHVTDLLQTRKNVKSTGYLVITGDRGLVGSYNSSAIKSVMSLLEDAKAQNHEAKILAIGSVGASFFKKNDCNIVYENNGISDVPTYEEVLPIISTAIQMYLNGVYDELYVCYTHHVNSLSSAFRVEKMLPIDKFDLNVKEAESTAKVDYEILPDPATALNTILPQYARSTIYGAVLDSKTAEHASSMTAMQNATDNAKDLVSTLTTQLNRARQAQITTEITEIIGGANALE
ncbi:MAG: F0F1 ATP synthase subunit gamma [Lactobacillus sp.]|nr:F0F1 ATP synthase subunit gamma [Lactobacillus sp.]